MGHCLEHEASTDRAEALPEGPVAGDILRGHTVSLSGAVEAQRFTSPATLLAELESRGYVWSWGYCTEIARHGMVTWRIVPRAGCKVAPTSVLLATTIPQLPKDVICTAGVPEARLHPNAALSITAFSPGAVAACRRWLAADFLPRVLPGLLGISPLPAAGPAGRAEDLLEPQRDAA
ncbi:MAG TPA: hypothetical protein PLZ79_09000 [Burkholderiales bacterium]|nr:hypothetical protein [Burkholderiaceae bacterium]HQR53397.1 hypothetical protein [Burkholderiales bacterium]